MTTSEEAMWLAFRREVEAAARANTSNQIVRAWPSARDGAFWMRTFLPYRFDPSIPVATLDASVRRGFGACAEAAAALLGWAWARSIDDVTLCLESEDPTYAHVVASVSGEPLDVYAERARALGSGCSLLWRPHR